MAISLGAAALPIIGSLYGGYEGYRRSGGDLGVAALSAGLSAAAPSVLRMAGTRFGGSQLGTQALAQGNKLLGSLQGTAIKSGLGPVAPLATLTPASMGTLAAGTAAFGTPALASLATRAAKGALPAATRTLGTKRMIQGVFDTATGKFTPLEGDPAIGMPRGPLTTTEMLDPDGFRMGQIEVERRQQAANLEAAANYMNLERSYLDEAKNRDLAREAAGKRLTTDLSTGKELTLAGQRIAGAMANQALADAGAGLRTQYRYL